MAEAAGAGGTVVEMDWATADIQDQAKSSSTRNEGKRKDCPVIWVIKPVLQLRGRPR